MTQPVMVVSHPMALRTMLDVDAISGEGFLLRFFGVGTEVGAGAGVNVGVDVGVALSEAVAAEMGESA